MNHPVVVSDTSPLRALHFLRRADLLESIFGAVVIPPAVAQELGSPASSLPPIPLAELRCVRVQAPTDEAAVLRLCQLLDRGESEAIALALELRADFLVADENRGRAEAVRLGLTVIGVMGILLRARGQGLVGPLAPTIRQLRDGLGFFIDERLELQVLEAERRLIQ